MIRMAKLRLPQSIVPTKGGDKTWKAVFSYQRSAQEQLTLDGEMDGHKIHRKLEQVDLSKLELVKRGFHWVQEYPHTR